MDLVSSINTFTSSYIEDDESANVILVDQFSSAISDSDLSEKWDGINSSVLFIFSPEPFAQNTSTPDLLEAAVKNEVGYRDPLSIILPISVCYLIILVTGILGNVITCVVIANNKTMHTATNYYVWPTTFVLTNRIAKLLPETFSTALQSGRIRLLRTNNWWENKFCTFDFRIRFKKERLERKPSGKQDVFALVSSYWKLS